MNRRLSRRAVMSGAAATAALGMTGCLQNPSPSGGGGGGPVERYTPGDTPGSGTVSILGAFGVGRDLFSVQERLTSSQGLAYIPVLTGVAIGYLVITLTAGVVLGVLERKVAIAR